MLQVVRDIHLRSEGSENPRKSMAGKCTYQVHKGCLELFIPPCPA
jgi:hypothetical protein